MGSTQDKKLNGVRYTGFSEPLSKDRNTTLPHLSADISPQEFLEASDIIVERSISRKRNHTSSKKGFLNSRDKEKGMRNADDLHAEHKAWEEFKSMARAANGVD
ncbi:hypothetical protein VE00_07905 [Pseudogymnoascus sp. WSF 3629]|nr:hypothetical protein VE00_07905 [Pseudogymnoascus sp. WSF 3629]